jgi:predicted acyltransferase
MGPAKALAEMLSGKGTILSTAGNIIGGQFEHAEWEGLRFYDLIFPLFIFVTGVAIVFSLTRLIEHESKSTVRWRVLRRSLLLFALGLVYGGLSESWPDSGVSESWPDIRLLGVLNRIALCYLFASLLFLNLRLPGLIVAFVAILVGYWALMTFVPVSGIGVGSYAKDANLANWIDAQYLPGRKWNGAWDPEGLLSTLPAIGTCLLGVFAGLLLKEPSLQPHQRTLWLIGAGAAMIALGVLWGLQFPIVKNIWTSSFVLVCGGLSALLLGVFHQVIDAWERRSWVHDLHLDRGERDHALFHQRHRGLPAPRNAAGRRRHRQLCGQPSDARRGELSRTCRGAADSDGAGRLLIPPQNLSARVTCAGFGTMPSSGMSETGRSDSNR